MAEPTPTTAPVTRTTGLVWGPSGGGKTTLLSTLPGKKLLASVDPDGYQSVLGRANITVIDLAQYSDKEIVNYVENKLPTFIATTEDFGPGDSLIFDSLSVYGLVALNEGIRLEMGKTRNFEPSLDAPGQAVYGYRLNHSIDAARKLLKATAKKGMHCWFTTHQATAKYDRDNNLLPTSTVLSDNTENILGLQISEVWHLMAMDREHRISIMPCRNRTPMKSRIFKTTGAPEFMWVYDPDGPEDQPGTIAAWYKQWVDGGFKKIDLPDDKAPKKSVVVRR